MKTTHDLLLWEFLLQADKLLVDEFEEFHDLPLLALFRFNYGIYLPEYQSNFEFHL
jgi:hypothetical protein